MESLIPFEMPTEAEMTVRQLLVHLATVENDAAVLDPFIAETLRDIVLTREGFGHVRFDDAPVAWHQPPAPVLLTTPAPDDGGPVWRQYGTCWRCADLDEPEVPQPLSMLWVAWRGRVIVELGLCAACRTDVDRLGLTWRTVPDAAV